ncbi:MULTISPECIES: transketolase [Enterococcus]|uniref:transketolase n=1 Tax=Enterococcus TaxID=1350 RepID=UPI0001B2BDD7|nr:MULTISPECIES: transketolase [Enterococcus]HAP3745511.1 transketolase [Enterococcus faecalis TDR28]HAP3751440.1 transketolase [Enterococcus faecalis TDR22]HAP3754440.1 transketolase [Enterococcus faecalis TDR13]HAP3757424.1 transketolase [Enterococcus faecalis TDR7]HAP3768293.1 transketolase [Enterococcus faecalis TDR19]HAP4960769.1 transketolase [Enterococcus faecalis ADL-336]
MFDKTDQLGVNTIRTLSIEAVQKANSGHPGLPMGAAPMAYALWTKHLKVNPTTSRNWVDRDRFVLSAGHGSAMLYSLLHLSGYNVTIDDLKNFRQWDSKTPGHPEVHHTDGVEATTGPLGQGIAMAVGMAMAEAHLAATYNRDSFPIMDHYTYAICGDGDLMEGVSQEASSMAGHMKLGKLIVLYDSNDISLDGPTSKAFTENVGARYEAYGWQHILVKDGNDLDEIEAAIEAAKAETDKPTLIEVKTVIGYGAPKEGTSSVHGAPIGEEGITAAKAVYGWEYPDFTVPEEVAARFKETMIDEGQKAEAAWNEMFKNYEHAHPELAKQFKEAFANQLPEGWEQELPKYELGTSAASRVTSKETIQAISKVVPSFWGGSADLSASNNTMVAAEKDFEPGQYEGRNIWFGVREFAMAAAMNGIQLHGGSHVYGGTFFVFTDYLRPAIRLAALQKVPVTYVLTHDSVAVGEDGPTHEPIEQLASVRCIPNVHVIRPADGNETVAAWRIAMTSTETPTILVLSRQNLPVLEGTLEHASDSVQKGAYVLSPQKGEQPAGILIATGSEVNLAVEAQAKLAEEGIDVSVVSMPSFDLFEKQSAEYKESVLPKAVTKRVAIEAAASFGWERYVGTEGKTITIDHFGASAPGGLVLEKFGFTPENVVNTYKSL